jgi:anthranilate phosphoribosyltransferase
MSFKVRRRGGHPRPADRFGGREISPESTIDRQKFSNHQSIPIDCCGTGGSGLSHFNTSTATAFALSAKGIPVVKFGNRSASGKSGSFDFLEAIGIRFTADQKKLYEIFEATKTAFLFAPYFYPALGKLARLRKVVGRKTILNFVGPLLNPVEPPLRLIGVSSKSVQTIVAKYLSGQDSCQRAYIVHCENGLDELDPNANNFVLKVEGSTLNSAVLSQTNRKDTPSEMLSLEDNVALFHMLIGDFKSAPSYYQRLVVLNAGMALLIADAAESLEDGKAQVEESFISGAVAKQYEELKKVHAKYS